MAKVLVTETYLEDIGDAIRSVNGLETTYKPSEMAAVIDDFYIEPTGTKTITANGTGIDVKDYASADVNVPNSYSASDEGKVVSEGELVAQGSLTITENDTYDTTLISELVANISGGGGGGAKNILGGTTEPTSAEGSNGDIYIKYTDNNVPSGYTPVEYISSDGNQYIVTDIPDRTQLRTVVDVEIPTGGASDQTVLGGVGGASSVIYLGFNFNSPYNGYYFNWTGSFLDVRGVADNSRHVVDVSLESGNIDIKKDGVSVFTATDTLSAVTASNNLYIFSRSNGNKKARAKLYGLKVYDYLDNGELIGHFVPVKRDSDDVVGLYDLISDVFYTNSGTGTFTAGEEIGVTPIDTVYLKVDGSWIILEDGDWDDVNTEGGGSVNILSGTDAPTSSVGSDGAIYLQCLDLLQELVTSESELNVTVTANSNWSGFEPWKAFSSSSGWIGNGGNPHWLQIEFPSATSIFELFFYASDGNRAHAVSRIGYSDDGTNFTDVALAESTMISRNGHVLLEQGCSAKYFRLYFDGSYGGSYYPMVGKLEIYGEGDTIRNTYLKVSGAWQSLIGSDIDDVDTGGGSGSYIPALLILDDPDNSSKELAPTLGADYSYIMLYADNQTTNITIGDKVHSSADITIATGWNQDDVYAFMDETDSFDIQLNVGDRGNHVGTIMALSKTFTKSYMQTMARTNTASQTVDTALQKAYVLILFCVYNGGTTMPITFMGESITLNRYVNRYGNSIYVLAKELSNVSAGDVVDLTISSTAANTIGIMGIFGD